MTYFLDRQSSVGHFKIHPETGELTVAELLDREEQDKFNLIVQVLLIESKKYKISELLKKPIFVKAYDNYQFGFTLGESRQTFCQVFYQLDNKTC